MNKASSAVYCTVTFWSKQNLAHWLLLDEAADFSMKPSAVGRLRLLLWPPGGAESQSLNIWELGAEVQMST